MYAAYTDYEYSDTERNFIAGNVSSEIFEEVESVFHQLSEFEQLKVVIELKNRFIKNESEIAELKNHLLALFHIDGEFSRPEKNFQNFMTKIFESNLNSQF